VVVIAVGAAFGYHVHWGGLVLLFVLLALLTAACSATSSALGLNLKQIGVARRRRHRGASCRSRCWRASCCPLSLGPAWLRVLGHVNPMYYARASVPLAGRGDGSRRLRRAWASWSWP